MSTATSELMSRASGAIISASNVVGSLVQDLDRIRTITKDDRSPVTVADFAAQAVVGLILRGCGVENMVGEEDASRLREDEPVRDEVVAAVHRALPNATADDVIEAIDGGDHEGGAEGTFWTLDPIDGTKGFLRGGQFALALALIDNGIVEIGLMGCPHWGVKSDPTGASVQLPGSICAAIRGQGAHAWVIGAEPETAVELRVSEWNEGDLIKTCESVESGHTSHDASARIVEIFSDHEAVRLDSQAKYAVVASGAADAYLRLPTRPGYVERIWDHAAGSLVATEAGAVVTDITGKTLDFSKGRGLEGNRGVVCATPAAHPLLIDRIRDIDLV
ncbi:MAG: 3'(2'),5'-bisphosphate nucleotidase [Phycisphaerales bacterium]|nr:3'(2'),5'-bisphosphate nucleotidase [Phycisphaerales bacterium]